MNHAKPVTAGVPVRPPRHFLTAGVPMWFLASVPRSRSYSILRVPSFLLQGPKQSGCGISCVDLLRCCHAEAREETQEEQPRQLEDAAAADANAHAYDDADAHADAAGLHASFLPCETLFALFVRIGIEIIFTDTTS